MQTAKAAMLAAAFIVIAGQSAHAATLTDSYDEWTANAGSAVYNTDTLGDDYTIPSSVHLLGGGSFTASDVYTGATAGDIRTIGSGWGTWSGNYGGQVLYSDTVDGDDTNAVTLTLSGLSAFAFEVQPFSTDQMYNVTVTLASGDSITDSVSGFGGAQFFGLYGGNLQSLTISTEDNAFAFGDFLSVPLSPVPLPGSAALFGVALAALGGLGLAAKRRRAVGVEA